MAGIPRGLGAKITLVYDARGNQIEMGYFDETGKPTALEDGYAKLTKTFHERGKVTEQAYFDEAGKPTWCKRR